MKEAKKYPPDWDEARIKRVIDFYENQSDEDAIAEAEAALGKSETIAVPIELVPKVKKLIADYLKKAI